MKVIEDSRDTVKRDLAEATDNIRRGTSKFIIMCFEKESLFFVIF